MKFFLHIFLLVMVVLTDAVAQDMEALVARRERIQRKYLRKQADVQQSDFTVPTGFVEDKRVAESEQMLILDAAFEKHEPSAMPPLPSMPRVSIKTERNWLLDSSELSGQEVKEGNSTKNSEYWKLFGASFEKKDAQPASTHHYDDGNQFYREESVNTSYNRHKWGRAYGMNPSWQRAGYGNLSGSSSGVGSLFVPNQSVKGIQRYSGVNTGSSAWPRSTAGAADTPLRRNTEAPVLSTHKAKSLSHQPEHVIDWHRPLATDWQQRTKKWNPASADRDFQEIINNSRR